MAGVLLQALFRNPLADSYVLGVSGGAALGALLALLLGGSLWLVQSAAATGAVLATLLVLALAHGGATVRVLLTGVVVASACGALVTLVLVLADNGQLRGMMFWLAGDLGWAARPWTMAGAALLATLAVSLIARPLDVLATGETTAQSLGLNLGTLAHRHRHPGGTAHRRAPSSREAPSDSSAWWYRTWCGSPSARPMHRVVVPAAALAGGTLLAAADLVARTAAAPRQLPVGAIMALAGSPGVPGAAATLRAAAALVTPFDTLSHHADDVRGDFDAIAAGALGAIQGRIGLRDQALGERLVVMRAWLRPRRGQPDRQGDRDVRAAMHANRRRAHALVDALGELERVRRLGAGQQDREFVAAETRAGVAGTNLGLGAPRRLP